jgi:hypothetical protein
MRKTLLAVVGCVGALLAFGFVVWRQSLSQPAAGPSVNVETIQFDFGRVRCGTVVHHDFEMHNDTADPRILGSVMTSCSCTTVGSNIVHAIPPHATALLPVDVTLKGLGGFQVKVFVGFTDESSLVLELSGQAVQQVPPELSFDAAAGQTEQRFAIKSVTSTPLTVKSLKCDSPDFEVSLIEPPATTAPTDPRVVVRFHPASSGRGKIAGELRIDTDDAVQPVKVISLTGSVHQSGDAK